MGTMMLQDGTEDLGLRAERKLLFYQLQCSLDVSASSPEPFSLKGNETSQAAPEGEAPLIECILGRAKTVCSSG